ncbi:hypothetical protein NIES2119_14490 [[Phormidium ambiguum] IAM M-71]|uniref:Uncharacterized protein n=1 Tax=[Phormidium ambiguum] IAM M-71 TaxID=454136 RepID=A0A1U7IIV2_9CYAN|nr:hypothetical protein [Phormidium ambiguum]OKH37028.1 hypothetical protein NIES2119_14490 [Phormidium ambiguum IAM M-71]
MFAQFRVRYPTGSLISELLTIYNGKFVVRALVQIDGVTKATGMAVADTIELAEDQARIRALELIGIHLSWGQTETIDRSISPEYSKPSVFASETREIPQVGQGTTDPTWSTPTHLDSSFPEKTSYSAKLHLEVTEQTEEKPDYSFVDRGENQFLETPKLTPVNSFADESESPVTFSKVTSIASRRHEPEIAIASSPELETETSDRSTEIIEDTNPDDFSDLIARTNVQIKRLGWTKKQGSDHLLRTYGKKTRNDLTKEELEDFLEYLEAQPNPS